MLYTIANHASRPTAGSIPQARTIEDVQALRNRVTKKVLTDAQELMPLDQTELDRDQKPNEIVLLDFYRGWSV